MALLAVSFGPTAQAQTPDLPPEELPPGLLDDLPSSAPTVDEAEYVLACEQTGTALLQQAQDAILSTHCTVVDTANTLIGLVNSQGGGAYDTTRGTAVNTYETVREQYVEVYKDTEDIREFVDGFVDDVAGIVIDAAGTAVNFTIEATIIVGVFVVYADTEVNQTARTAGDATTNLTESGSQEATNLTEYAQAEATSTFLVLKQEAWTAFWATFHEAKDTAMAIHREAQETEQNVRTEAEETETALEDEADRTAKTMLNEANETSRALYDQAEGVALGLYDLTCTSFVHEEGCEAFVRDATG